MQGLFEDDIYHAHQILRLRMTILLKIDNLLLNRRTVQISI